MKRTLWTIAIGSGLFVGAVAFGAAQTQTPKSAGGDVTFYKDVLPILQNRCQTCHRPGQIGPMSLLSYEQTRPSSRLLVAQERHRPDLRALRPGRCHRGSLIRRTVNSPT